MSGLGESIPPDDRGLLLGDGLFETILAQAGRLDHFEAHIVRMIPFSTPHSSAGV